MPVAVVAAAAGVVGGRIYVMGGLSASGIVGTNQIYDPATNSWRIGAPVPVAVDTSAAVVVGNVLYLFGGRTDQGANATVWAYHALRDTWSAASRMPTPRWGMTAGTYDDVTFLIGGTTDGTNRLDTVESYVFATKRWAEEMPIPLAKGFAGGGRIGTEIVVPSGNDAELVDTDDNEGYRIVKNAWTKLAPEPIVINSPSCPTAIGGQVYQFGGSVSGTTVSDTQIFNLQQNVWKTGTPMPHGVEYAAGAIYKGLIYCFGGASDSNTNIFNLVQIYRP